MSGPKTVIYETSGNVIAGATGLAAVIFAARALKEVHDIHAEYGEAYKRVCERESIRIQQRYQLQDTKRQQIANLHREAEHLQAKLSRLNVLVHEQLGDQASAILELTPPFVQDERSMLDYIGQLRKAIASLQSQLTLNEGITALDMTTLLAEQPNTIQLLTAYAQQYAAQSQLTLKEQTHYQELAQHVISRLELADGEALPIRIESLAREILQASDGKRADALASDLRLEIQRINQHRTQQLADSLEAQTLLSQLADVLPEALRSKLEQVSAGVQLLDEPTLSLTNSLLEEVKAARKREEQEAVAVVLEQSLRDLGYDVSDIGETLFVTGGMVHFQKQSWQNYHVRMRVNTADKSINLNVVRAKASDDAAQDKRLDHLAEDRWCSEFPALLKTLEARGVKLNVTRHLQAGEVPVQVVDAATLPAVRTQEERFRTAPAKQMTLDGKPK